MPKDFDRCVQMGGKVRTMKMGGGRYRHVCIMNGKTHMGEVKTAKPKKKKKR